MLVELSLMNVQASAMRLDSANVGVLFYVLIRLVAARSNTSREVADASNLIGGFHKLAGECQ